MDDYNTCQLMKMKESIQKYREEKVDLEKLIKDLNELLYAMEPIDENLIDKGSLILENLENSYSGKHSEDSSLHLVENESQTTNKIIDSFYQLVINKIKSYRYNMRQLIIMAEKISAYRNHKIDLISLVSEINALLYVMEPFDENLLNKCSHYLNTLECVYAGILFENTQRPFDKIELKIVNQSIEKLDDIITNAIEQFIL